MRKIKSGVYGLNSLIDGGLNEYSTTVVIGCAGAGKTTFATQFVRRGLELGQEAIFVSLDENKEQIIKEAVEMGWGEILDYLDREQLIFIDASGKEFSTFIKKELPDFVEEWKGYSARVAIDPLTPVIWATKDMYERRDMISFMFKQLRKIGTILCTLEEHGTQGDLTGEETIIPMYLADCVIHLRFRPNDNPPSRVLKIVKARSTRHSEDAHPYKIIRGLGIVLCSRAKKEPLTTEIPGKLLNELSKYENILPKPMFAKLTKFFKDLRDQDFKDVDTQELINSIIEEFKV